MEKKKKDDLGKELMQCIAFAHFAVHKYSESNSSGHEQSFYDLFDVDNKKIDDTFLKPYMKYLGSKFNFRRIQQNWKNKLTESGKVSVDITTKIVYDVAKRFYLSNLISKNFNQYQFLDQSDEFMILLKTKCLTKIVNALKLPFKIDILSSADMYIVKTDAKDSITKELEKEIMNQSDYYIINNYDNYNDILINRWKKHELFGISLKLPTSNKNKNIKILGVPDNALSKKMKNKIDPYVKFIALLSDPKTNVHKMIDETIEIGEYDLKNMDWDFPFKFKYKKLGLYQSDVNFHLLAWPNAQTAGGGSAGFNGKFLNTPGYGSQWVGGTGFSTIESFLFTYPEFNKIMSELISIRRKALNYVLTGSISKSPNINQIIDTKIKIELKEGVARTPKYNKAGKFTKMGLKTGEEKGGLIYSSGKKTAEIKIKNLQSLYASALREISQRNFTVKMQRQEKIMNFFEEYDNAMGTAGSFLRYMDAVYKLCQKKPLSVASDIKTNSQLNTYYEHSQLSYFLLRGGPTAYKYLKQRIFLTVFGVITKKSYKIFQVKNANQLWNSTQVIGAIRAQVCKKLVQNIKEFDTVPHFYMS